MFKVGDRVRVVKKLGHAHPAVAGDVVTLEAVGSEWLCPAGARGEYFSDKHKREQGARGYGWKHDHFRKVKAHKPTRVATTLPTDSTARKDFPLWRGLLRYFPAALAGAAKVSKLGSEKHHPGKPMHHERGKSADHADCILRHLMDFSEDYGKGTGLDESGVPQVDYIVWRACALAQEWHEQHGAPIAPGTKP